MMRRPGFCSPTAPMPCPLRVRPLCAPRSILSPICQGSRRPGARVFAAAKTTKNPIKGFLVLAACYFVVRRNSGEPPLPYCAAALGRLNAAGQRKYGCPDTGLPRPFSRPRRGPRRYQVPQKSRLGLPGSTIPSCMALPCCPPFAQGGLRSASGPVAGRPYCAPALGNRAKAGCVLGFS